MAHTTEYMPVGRVRGPERTPVAPRGRDLLLFLLQPEPAAIEDIDPLLREVQGAVGGRQGCMARERLHATLFPLGYHDGLPPALVQAALQAGGSLNAEPFGVSFGHLRPFFDREERAHHGAALFDGGPGLRRFRRLLGDCMAACALQPWVRERSSSHVSLYYGDASIAARKVTPLQWWVREFCLVHSLQGLSRHVVLGRWRLQGRQAALDFD